MGVRSLNLAWDWGDRSALLGRSPVFDSGHEARSLQ
jgi:hypothetical protein